MGPVPALTAGDAPEPPFILGRSFKALAALGRRSLRSLPGYAFPEADELGLLGSRESWGGFGGGWAAWVAQFGGAY